MRMWRRRNRSLAGSLPRILMIAPTPFFADRGCHVRIYEEARALQALGCQVEVCTYHLGRDRPGLTTHRTPRIPWYNKLAAGFSWHKFYIDVLLAFKAWRVAHRFRPDLIHGHLHEGAVIGWAVGQALRAPVIGDFQGSLSGELKAHEVLDEHSWFYRFVAHNERWIDRLPNVAVASCSDVADELRDRFGVSDVILALDGVDTEAFRPGLETGELASLVPDGRRVVAYLGLLNAYQGVDHLLEAVPRVLARVPEAYFLLMGYQDEEKYRQKAREMGLAEYVSFPGRIDYGQAPRYLALGEVAVGPKLSETESNGKLYNYMACGLPTVAYDTPVSREILGDLGVYAPRGDVPALADAIAGLLENPEAARRLGQELRQRVVERFSWEHTAKQLLAAYALAIPKKLMAKNPGAVPGRQEEAGGKVHPAER
jgi:glycosyltransferase involved in cell wall biosynthesis